MSRCCQIRCRIRPTPYSTIFSNRTHHWSIELLMIFFQSIPCIWHCCCLWLFHRFPQNFHTRLEIDGSIGIQNPVNILWELKKLQLKVFAVSVYTHTIKHTWTIASFITSPDYQPRLLPELIPGLLIWWPDR